MLRTHVTLMLLSAAETVALHWRLASWAAAGVAGIALLAYCARKHKPHGGAKHADDDEVRIDDVSYKD